MVVMKEVHLAEEEARLIRNCFIADIQEQCRKAIEGILEQQGVNLSVCERDADRIVAMLSTHTISLLDNLNFIDERS